MACFLSAAAILFAFNAPRSEANSAGKKDAAVELCAAFADLGFEGRKRLVQFDPKRVNDAYLQRKFARIAAIKGLIPDAVRGRHETKSLLGLIVAESPRDLDPIVFYKSPNGLKIVLNITRLNESGLEADREIAGEYDSIVRKCDELKADLKK